MKKYRSYTLSGSGTKSEQGIFDCEVKKDSVTIYCYKTLIDGFPTKSITFKKDSNSAIGCLEIYDDFFKLYFRGSGTPIIFEEYENT